MRAVVQRVSRARVVVGKDVVGEIGAGLVALIGVGHEDGSADARAIAGKLAGLRIFPDSDGKMNLSVSDVGGDVLVVSQFTLLADVRKGRRPSFTAAAVAELAEPLVDEVAAGLTELGVGVAGGRFGAHMEVDLVNDGPVTIVVETSGGSVI